ncbi:adenylate kinase 8 isoform X3 [Eleginops maclovinus]|uniref:adenylate kinase 8 isoform X3 n=1 Tax=Eleginops maclovinus TaxID=56733 RepID=UPI003080E12C
MDETVKPLRIPPQMSVYADKHNIFHLLQSIRSHVILYSQSMLSGLVVEQPADPLSFLIALLQRSSTDIPRVLLLGPPAVGKHTMAQRLSADLRAVHVTLESLLSDQSELSAQARRVPPTEPLPVELLLRLVQRRLGEIDCFSRGWVLEGIPQTHLQALSLQQAGVLPEHVVMLEAPDDVLLERSRGKMVDPLTGDVYHRTFILPPDASVARRLEERRPAEPQRDTALQRFRREVPGLRSAYQSVLRVVNADQPHADVYQQVLAFVRTRRRSRIPRILLLGPPGSGKSLQARLLSEKYRMVDVPDSLVLQVLEERLGRVECSTRGWILHGFPRDLQQAKSLQEALQPNRVFFLELADDVCLERITLRATDPVSGERFHAVSHPAPSSEVQKRLQTRPEDSSHTVTHTLRQYRTHTAALQAVYPGAGVIDADQDPLGVFEALQSRLTAD